ncbi:hypothetical protein BBJ28_00004978 [Nothophytophthora sp. Chile5]|nr:hypothetical protein BBJ28_00004978 [Nothophytophthora sp. Chile5]
MRLFVSRRCWLLSFTAFVAFAIGVVVTWVIVASTSSTSEEARPVLLLTGDSLTEYGTKPENDGWISLLQDRYCRTADIMARGLSGYNTKYVSLSSWLLRLAFANLIALLNSYLSRWFIEDALPVIEGELASHRISPALITLWLGANDAALLNGTSAWQHVPLEEYAANLAKIVLTFRLKAPTAQILLITPAFVDDSRRMSANGTLDRSNAASGEYAQKCVETAQEIDTPVLDLYSVFSAMPDNESATYLEDGLHFNAEGNRLVDQELRATMASEFPGLVSRLGTWDLPSFTQFEQQR